MRSIPTLLTWAIVFAAGCADDGGRDTPGGGFKASCMVTADCGCVSRFVDDPFCTGAEPKQLQCLGGVQSKCTLSCTLDTQCTSVFAGGQASCSSFGYCE
jgi:hypothetical protein